METNRAAKRETKRDTERETRWETKRRKGMRKGIPKGTRNNCRFKLKACFKNRYFGPACATGSFDLKALWAESETNMETIRDATNRETKREPNAGIKRDTKMEAKRETEKDSKLIADLN